MDTDEEMYDQFDQSFEENHHHSDETKKPFLEGGFFQVLTPSETEQFMQSMVLQVSNVITLPPTTTRILLTHCKWDKERLLERYYGDDLEKLFKEARVVYQPKPSKKKKVAVSLQRTQN